ncbi:hypothetical protein ACOSP7_009857 [Xanthoceras sorbifolium]
MYRNIYHVQKDSRIHIGLLKIQRMRCFHSTSYKKTKISVSNHMLSYITVEVEIQHLLQCCLRITLLFFPLLMQDEFVHWQQLGNCCLSNKIIW